MDALVTELAVLVPVLDRPQNVEPLVASFRQSGAPGDLVFLVNASDTTELRAVKLSHARRVECPDDVVTWPAKQNYGVAHVEADWYLLAGDDVTFEPGWWQATQSLRDDPGVSVIGTQDGANARVIAGEHSTHTLVRGTYIREQGTIDEPGKVVHGGYSHWFVDDELLWTAKVRGVWAFCNEARVLHHHPYFDPSIKWDATYAKGESRSAEDQAIWVQRAPLLGLQVNT